MRRVEFHRYWVALPGRKVAFLTDFVMDAETAERDYPGATPEASSRVVCEEPETEEERIERMSPCHSPVRYTRKSAPASRHHIPMKAGRYRFVDDIGGPPQALDVIQADGEFLVRFPATDGEDGADLPLRDLAGQFLPLEQSVNAKAN